jgi:hypothetical protein
MKFTKLSVALAALLIAGSAMAEGIYASVTFDKKDKLASSQVNNVYGLNIGQKFADGLTVEARMEDERVETFPGQKQEGLYQIKASQDLSKFGVVTPYVAGAVGVKNKSTIDFPFWVAEAGAKVKLSDSISVRYGWRQRVAFDDNTTNSYNTRENTLALGYSLTKQDTVTVAAKKERGTSNYNTTGLYYSRSF